MKAVVTFKRDILAVKKAGKILKSHGFDVKTIQRNKIERQVSADLIVPVGGDGTVLATVPFAGDIPILAVNAFPGRSVGFFCSVTIENLSNYLKKIDLEKTKPTKLPLLKLSIGGKKIKEVALNEFLLASRNPSHTVKYELMVGKQKEKQRSSGIWISAGPGSTAVIRMAGGKKMAITSNQLQYLVREPCPYTDEKYKLLSGVLKAGQKFIATSNVDKGRIFPDGRGPGYKWSNDKKAIISVSKRKLNIYI